MEEKEDVFNKPAPQKPSLLMTLGLLVDIQASGLIDIRREDHRLS